jgi:two-component system response regulator VicR
MKILVVDDNPDVVFSMKAILESISDDFNIIESENGEQCLNVISKEIPDLILLDLMMPKMDGWEVINHIQTNNDWRDIPIIIFTAAVESEYKKTAEELGIAYIKKPFSIDAIKEKIEQIIK